MHGIHKVRNYKNVMKNIIFIDLWNPLQNVCDFPFVLLSYLDVQAFLLQTGVKIQDNVILDSFRSMRFGGVFFPGYGSWGVVRCGVASG